MSAPVHNAPSLAVPARATLDKLAATLDRLGALAIYFGDGNLALSVIDARELVVPGAPLDVELTAAHASTLVAALHEVAKEDRGEAVDAVEFLSLASTLAGCVYEVADLAGRGAR